MDGPTFAALFPRARSPEEWAASLTAAAEEFDIAQPARMAMWLAQLAHECAGFTRFVESMAYSAQRLAEVWPSRYSATHGRGNPIPNELAHRLAGKPDVIASDVYANRMGNGDPSTRDGWRYRGRYPVMLTGRDNYTAAEDALGLGLLDDPDALLEDIPGMARVSGWYWCRAQCSEAADRGDFEAVTRKVNGGMIGLADRVAWHKRVMIALDIA